MMAFVTVSLQSQPILVSVLSSVLNISLALISSKNDSDISSQDCTHDYVCVGCLAVVLGEHFMKEQNESLACGCLEERKRNNRGGWQNKTKQS